MGKIIAISNQKGGVGKTTSTFNLGIALAKENKRVLIVDVDPQSNLTTYAGYYKETDLQITLADLMKQSINDLPISINESIKHHNENIDLIPSTIELAALEKPLADKNAGKLTLKKCLSNVKNDYDYILLDCQPSLGMLTINALSCADSVIIPVQSQFFAAIGMTDLFKIVNEVKRELNPNLKLDGIFFTLVDKRTNLSKEVEKQIRENYGGIIKIYDTQIPYAVKTAESSYSGKSIFSYAKKSKVVEAYSLLAKEVLKDGKEYTKNATTKVR